MKGPIYLIGLMGAGKSTVGKLLAQKLDWGFMDLDQEIENTSGITVSQIFSDSGEEKFRDLETKVLHDTKGMMEKIIACGGGIVTREENVEFLHDSTTIWLELSPEEAAHRLEYASDRPLLSECKDTLKKLGDILESRQGAYARSASFRINAGGDAPEAVADMVLKELRALNV